MCGKNLEHRHTCPQWLGSPPRVREKRYNVFDRLVHCGITPRVREKLLQEFCFVYSYRITPASAGKTCPWTIEENDGRDHPRECGKNGLRHVKCVLATGSPPRVREKPKVATNCDKRNRITPASAGKTQAQPL